jgi:nitrate reductase gamma subunit
MATFCQLSTFPPGKPKGFLVHIFLAFSLLAIFPISKLLHVPGIFFSPTRNQVDDSRKKRHISPWALKQEKEQ